MSNARVPSRLVRRRSKLCGKRVSRCKPCWPRSMLGGPGLHTRRQRASLGLHSVDTGCRRRSASAKGVLCVVDMCVCVGASKGGVYEKEHRRSRIMLAHAARDWSHTLQWHQAHIPRTRRGVGGACACTPWGGTAEAYSSAATPYGATTITTTRATVCPAQGTQTHRRARSRRRLTSPNHAHTRTSNPEREASQASYTKTTHHV